MEKNMSLNAIELCAGGGGQALGLEMAGFHHVAAVEYEPQYCATLRKNRPQWNVLKEDIRSFRCQDYSDVDLIAGGVPCPPFSIAGKQLGADDDRDMFPAAVSIIGKIRPRAVLLENVPGLAGSKFEGYRRDLMSQLSKFGYQPEWKVLQASDYGVPQLRPRFILIALRPGDAQFFEWPNPGGLLRAVGETLVDLMEENGWPGAESWATQANTIAPTIVGGSKKHGGPDLGPTRARLQWRQMRVDGLGIADEAPDQDFPEQGMPRLTPRMVARIQSFPDDWEFVGGKTIACRQIGNAFPPLVAKAVGLAIRRALQRQRHSINGEKHVSEYRLLEKYTPSPRPKKQKTEPKNRGIR
jgi:DNA (cytosine-5)-methyltransferase 1